MGFPHPGPALTRWSSSIGGFWAEKIPCFFTVMKVTPGHPPVRWYRSHIDPIYYPHDIHDATLHVMVKQQKKRPCKSALNHDFSWWKPSFYGSWSAPGLPGLCRKPFDKPTSTRTVASTVWRRSGGWMNHGQRENPAKLKNTGPEMVFELGTSSLNDFKCIFI